MRIRLARLGPVLAASLATAIAVDGDTLRLGRETWRLAGIDAPERGTAAGRRAAEALRSLIGDRDVTCRQRGTETSYGRKVGFCTVDGQDLGEAMLRSGQACRWARYDREGRYAGLALCTR